MNQNRRVFYVLLALVLSVPFCCVPSVAFLTESCVSSRSRTIAGQEFCHTVRVQHGIASEEFLCNGIPLEPDEYQKKLDAACLKQLHDQDQLLAAKKQQSLQWQQEIATKIIEKIALQQIEKIDELITLLQQDVLQNYVVFADRGLIVSHGQLSEVARSVPVWKQQMSTCIKNHAPSELQKLSQHLEKIVVNLESIFALTMKNATARCDDTQILKQLLDLCAQ